MSASWRTFELTTDVARAANDREAWIFGKCRIDDRSLAQVKRGPPGRLDSPRVQTVCAQPRANWLIVRTFDVSHADTTIDYTAPIHRSDGRDDPPRSDVFIVMAT